MKKNLKLDQISEILNKILKPNEPGAVISVYSEGETAIRKAVGMGDMERNVPLIEETVMDVASISKQFVAACIYILAAEEKLTIKDTINQYVNDYPDYAKGITIEQLIFHTSGLKDYMDLLESANMREENRYTRKEIIDLIFSQEKLDHIPGDKFNYTNSGYILLTEIIYKITGKPLATYADEKIFTPLGMSNTLFYDNCNKIIPNRALSYSKKEYGYENFPYIFDVVGDTGLLTTVQDLTTWGKLFIETDHKFTSLVSDMICEGKLNNGKNVAYAGGLFLYEYKGHKTLCHGGSAAGYRSDLLIIPEKKLIITFMSNFDKMEFISWSIADLFISDA